MLQNNHNINGAYSTTLVTDPSFIQGGASAHIPGFYYWLLFFGIFAWLPGVGSYFWKGSQLQLQFQFLVPDTVTKSWVTKVSLWTLLPPTLPATQWILPNSQPGRPRSRCPSLYSSQKCIYQPNFFRPSSGRATETNLLNRPHHHEQQQIAAPGLMTSFIVEGGRRCDVFALYSQIRLMVPRYCPVKIEPITGLNYYPTTVVY